MRAADEGTSPMHHPYPITPFFIRLPDLPLCCRIKKEVDSGSMQEHTKRLMAGGDIKCYDGNK
jgi:hypothetical protein